MNIRLPSLPWLLLALVAPLRAAGPYLHGFDPVLLLPPPTALHSGEDEVDRATALRVYRARTPEDVARGKAESKVTLFAFTPEVGPFLQPGKFPKLEALIKQVDAEIKKVTDAGKNHWKRLRPFQEDPTDYPEIADPETTPGYPSAHSTRGTAFAALLSEIFPDQRAALADKGRLIGWTRVEIGDHTPQDIYAGRVLGQALAQAFLRDPAFQHDLAEVKAEVAAGKSP